MSLFSKILLGFAACLTAFECGAQQTLRVMEYNVENLFDCRHDSLKHDSEYLPHATRGWSWKRYHEKLNRIAKVILAASGEQVPTWSDFAKWKCILSGRAGEIFSASGCSLSLCDDRFAR